MRMTRRMAFYKSKCLRALGSSVWQMTALVTATILCATSAIAQVKDAPLPVTSPRAFPHLKFDLPIFVTHAGDGSNRVFVGEQRGQIRVFPNRSEVKTAKVFLDIHERVVYKDSENEEGLLGLAFHPQYKENGQFFVFYTVAGQPHTQVISRFRVSKDDPDRADPRSEEELIRVPKPYWNHNGGTLCFGPDGFLYFTIGDGGAANDPHNNGQNLRTLLGKICRIDVDRRPPQGAKYHIPQDNPFVPHAFARGEIWAYGLRNVWRMSFDRKTGRLWAADVGQDLWEEINMIERGGNYGWNLREGKHKFGPRGSDPRPDLIEPIFEYHHTLGPNAGKSITGGHVYRGKQVPALDGLYLYADYVTGKVFALAYDEKTKRVTANHSIPSTNLPVMTFGEDEPGEAYYTVRSGEVYTFAPQ